MTELPTNGSDYFNLTNLLLSSNSRLVCWALIVGSMIWKEAATHISSEPVLLTQNKFIHKNPG